MTTQITSKQRIGGAMEKKGPPERIANSRSVGFLPTNGQIVMSGFRGVPAVCIRGQTDLYGRRNWEQRERPERRTSLHLPRSFYRVSEPIRLDVSIRARWLIVLRLFHSQRSVQPGQQLRPFVGPQLSEVLKFPAYRRQILCAGQLEERPIRLAALH